jgi:protein-disulfide isomerase
VTESPSKASSLNIVWLLAVFLPVAFILGIGAGYLVWGRGQDERTASAVADAIQATAVANRPQPPKELKRYDVPIDDDYVLGPADAPITIIEFSDYQCPYCLKWYSDVYQPLLKAYPGKIRFVYRDFPLLSIHPNALPAAEAANCAGEQGKYYEYHNALFGEKYSLGDDAYTKYASEMNLDMTQFNDCIQSGRSKTEVMADLDWASQFGVQSTPTFFINGIPLVGAQPLETFQMVIDWALEGKLPKN